MNPGAETIQIPLSRSDSGQPWGFRLQGGADFTTPLSIQSVTPAGVGERCGLQAGDAVLTINGQSTENLDHEDAKRIILMSAISCGLVIERGAVTVWKPSVTPLSELKSGPPQQIPDIAGGSLPYVQKTSLAANSQQEYKPIGSSHNRSAKPFPGFGGGAPSQPAVVNAQFNSPINMYSNNNTQQVYNAKAQDLSSGMAGLQVAESQEAQPSSTYLAVHGQSEPPNTKTPTYLSTNENKPVRSVSPTTQLIEEEKSTIRSVSPTAQALMSQEAQRKMAKGSAIYKDVPEGEEREYSDYVDPNKQSFSFKMLEKDLAGGGDGSGSSMPKPTGMRSVRAPTALPPSEGPQSSAYMTCKACDRLIVGVFVKVRGEPMHPDCYKCTRCSTSLKQKGFIVLEDRLYCESCARQVAVPPEPGLEIDEVVYS